MAIPIGVDLTAALINNEFSTLLTAFGNVAVVDTAESRTSTAYGALTTAGPAVTLTSVGTRALVFISFRGWDGTASSNIGAMGVVVSGATSIAANDSAALLLNGATGSSGGGIGVESGMMIPIAITPGSNTFTSVYKSASGSSFSFAHRKITVFAP